MKTFLESLEKLKGLPIAKTLVVKSESNLNKINFPYYMKASLSGHKIEQKAVLRCENENDAIRNYQFLKNKFKKTPIAIQEQVVGAEMILGLKQDFVFGKLLMIGFGGTNAEVLKDVEFRAVPLSKQEIAQALESLKLYPTLFKRTNYAIDKFIELAYKVSQLKFKELDLNPVILNEEKAVIVDARLE